MKSYNSTLTGLKSKSLFTATLLLSVALNFIGIIQLSAQEHVDIDTLLYCYHNPEQDQYPDMLPEDCYMELYLENGTLKKGYFWGTTDEFEQVREGYECGYFVMPMTNIRQGKDSISFCLNIVKTSSGEKVNTFVKAPINLHIRSWQEAMSRYQTWEPFTDRMEDEIQMSISFARWLDFVSKSCMIPLTDSPYTDYMVLTFNKDGLFKEALNILHVTDDSYIEDLSSALTLQLKNYEKLWIKLNE